MGTPMRRAPCIPHWLTLEREAEMQVDDRIRNCAVFVGNLAGDQFDATGTGFVASLTIEGLDFRYVITAGHVVWPERRLLGNRTAAEGTIAIRVNTKNRSTRNIMTNKADWIFPQDKFVDLCALRFSEAQHNPNSDFISTTLNLSTMSLINRADNFEQYNIYRIFDREICLGDEVFLTGAFISHVETKQNIPIIRVGNIAAMPEEPIHYFSPRRPAYLIETRSLGGLSGSPVFLHLYPDRPRGDVITMGHAHAAPGARLKDGDQIIMPYVLIGMVLGAASGQYPADFEGAPAPDAEFNSGISVVLPIREIIEFLHSPILIEERMRTVEEIRRISGYPARIIRE